MANTKDFFRQHPVIKHLLLMVLTALCILIIIFILLKMYAHVGQEYKMYDLIGQKFDQINDSSDIRLRYVVIDSIYDENQAGGTILTQDPKPGSMVKRGRKVYVTIAAYSAEEAVMPDLTDMTVRQAISQLSSVGFTVGYLKFVESPFRNAVLEQNHKGRVVQPGTPLEKGSVIDLTIGMGEGNNTNIIPFVIGKSPTKARNAILSSSFNIGAEHFNGVTDCSHAVVVRQEPDYTGVSRYPYGTQVELWYSSDSDIDVDKMVNDFHVDSSKIIYTNEYEENNTVDDSWQW
jgi:beta-lactam-binding protein with PASTA domain